MADNPSNCILALLVVFVVIIGAARDKSLAFSNIHFIGVSSVALASLSFTWMFLDQMLVFDPSGMDGVSRNVYRSLQFFVGFLGLTLLVVRFGGSAFARKDQRQCITNRLFFGLVGLAAVFAVIRSVLFSISG
jgi:hypothetical protein